MMMQKVAQDVALLGAKKGSFAYLVLICLAPQLKALSLPLVGP